VATANPTKPPLTTIGRIRNPLALWHLLSLDAPTVATLWTWFIASTNHVMLPLSSALAMTLAVWTLYAGDRLMDARLMDARPLDNNHEDFEARHHFHHLHRSAFLTGIFLASIALATLLPHLEPAAIRLYVILGALVSAYFILIHATTVTHRLPKEIAVGLFFAAATFIPTVARCPDLRLALLPAAILFAALCSLNCLFIYAWEHPAPYGDQRTHTITRLALRNLPLLTILLIISSLAIALLDSQTPWPITSAIAIAAILLLLLHNQRHAISRVTLRAAADIALTTPLLLFPFLHQ
jgi:hypothetical protein